MYLGFWIERNAMMLNQRVLLANLNWVMLVFVASLWGPANVSINHRNRKSF